MDVRKNAASLSQEEWDQLINAFVTLKHTFAPGSDISIFDTFVAIHLGVWQLLWGTGDAAGVDGAHGGPAFLPWHREYLRRLEKSLQTVEPEVTLPYWNWGLGTAADIQAPLTANALGPEGSGPNNEVTDGHFKLAPDVNLNPLGWPVDPRLNINGWGPAMRRNPTIVLRDGMAGILSATAYGPFFAALETGPHNRIHGDVGGNMGNMASPNDPLFWLHHCQVDHIWAMWQEDHPGAANYNPTHSGGHGHRVDDLMWPWDGGRSTPGADPWGIFDAVIDAATGTNLVGTLAATDLVTPRETIDHHALGYCYDTEPDCPCPEVTRPIPTTLRVGEERAPTLVFGENPPTTLRRGEEGPWPTTMALGEEGPGPTTLALGEEGPGPTTLALGEEGPNPTTFAIGEEGPVTDPRLDDPVPPFDFDRFGAPGARR